LTVSILIPSFNHARFLPACLESVLAQTFEDWEAIVVDDRSTDDSFEIARSYAAKDLRIQAFQNEENRGTYGTQQFALRLAKGGFIAVLNSDDYWIPEKLAVQTALLQAHADAAFAYALGQTVDESGQPYRTQNQHGDWPTEARQNLVLRLLQENRVLASSVLFRRKGLRFHQDLRYSGDWVALLEQIRLGPAVFSNDFLSAWRQHEQNTYQRSKGQVLEEIRVRRAITNERSRWHQPGFVSLEIEQAIAVNCLHLQALALFAGDRNLARSAAMGAGAHPNS
jgi:glycosyltransferase involved in cell wall biosynthesis